ncbi:LCP family protein, partial [bacterium]|nr:LCP family protein [bacterium]
RGGTQVYQISKGWHHLNGEEALKYARSRYTTSDFDRARRQQQIILALKEKTLSLNLITSPAKVAQLLSAFQGMIETDLTPQEIWQTYELIKDVKAEEVATKVLDSSSGGLLYADRVNGMYVLKPKDPTWEEIRALAHSIFIEPFLEKEKAKIIVENGAGVSGLAFRVSSLLKSRGYTVVAYRTAKELTEKTKIIDCSSGEKPYSLQLLRQRFPYAEVVSCSSEVDRNADFVIILGQDFDYQNFSQRKI